MAVKNMGGKWKGGKFVSEKGKEAVGGMGAPLDSDDVLFSEPLRASGRSIADLKQQFAKELEQERSGEKIQLEGRTKAQIVQDMLDRGVETMPAKGINVLIREPLAEIKEKATRFNLYGEKKGNRVQRTATDQVIGNIQDRGREKYGFSDYKFTDKIKQSPALMEMALRSQQKMSDYVASYNGAVPPSKVKEYAKLAEASLKEVADAVRNSK